MYGSEVNLSDPVRMTEEQKTIVQDFNCGNEVINSYLKEKACDDPQTVTFIVKDKSNNKVICYYSLSCSGLVLDHGTGNKITIYPAVEIKMFAIDENYQHIPYHQLRIFFMRLIIAMCSKISVSGTQFLLNKA